jgi:putative transposase
MSLSSGAHIKYELVYHVQWCTKYRYKIFREEGYKCDYENVLNAVASWHDIQIVEYAVQPEHVHAIISVKPTMGIPQIFQYLKGGTSFQFFRMHPEFRQRYPDGHLFSPGKFCRTVGPVDLRKEIDYVRNQSGHREVDLKQKRLSGYG